MKRLLAALAVSVGVFGAQASTASGMEYFCDWDPTVVVVTPAGNLDVVYLSVYTPNLRSVGLPLDSYTTARAYDSKGNPVTDVDVSVYVPGGLLSNFPTYSLVSTGLLGGGQVLGTGTGVSSSVTHVHFRINRP